MSTIPKPQGRAGFLVGEQNGQTVVHQDGDKGGVIHGQRHKDGGVAAVNTDTGQQLEVEKSEVSISPKAVNANDTHTFDGKKMTNKEVLSAINQSGGGVPIKKKGGAVESGGKAVVNQAKGDEIKYPSSSVIITRPAVFDKTKRMFDGKMMTNLEILSLLNERAGGVAFSEKDLPEKISLNGKEYEFGGKMTKDYDIANSCGCKHELGGKTGDSLEGMPRKIYDKAVAEFMSFDEEKRREAMQCTYEVLEKIKERDHDTLMLLKGHADDYVVAAEAFLKDYDNEEEFEKGGISEDSKKEVYEKWKSLVNMSESELQKFYDSAEGRIAGLSAETAKELGIHSGRESARWIMKMKKTPYTSWTPKAWEWAKRQISFISRMKGAKGDLYDDKGRKTRKHLALLIWGHNPEEKREDGGKLGSAESGDSLVANAVIAEREEANSLIEASPISELSKAIVAAKKIQHAKEMVQSAQNPDEENMWTEIQFIWSECLKNIKVSSI